RETRKLVEWVAARGGRVTVRQMQNSNSRKWPSGELAEAALLALVDAGLGRWEQGPAPARGRPARFFVLELPASDTFSSDTFSAGGGDPQRNGTPHHTSDFRGRACDGADSGGNGGPDPAEKVSEEKVSDGHGDAWEG